MSVLSKGGRIITVADGCFGFVFIECDRHQTQIYSALGQADREGDHE
jgi:hypothetical protein